jgi:hypothetical protein
MIVACPPMVELAEPTAQPSVGLSMKMPMSPLIPLGGVTALHAKPFQRTMIGYWQVACLVGPQPTAHPSVELSILMARSDEFVGVPLGTDVHIEPSHFSIVAGPFVVLLPTAQLSVWLTESTAYSV